MSSTKGVSGTSRFDHTVQPNIQVRKPNPRGMPSFVTDTKNPAPFKNEATKVKDVSQKVQTVANRVNSFVLV